MTDGSGNALDSSLFTFISGTKAFTVNTADSTKTGVYTIQVKAYNA